MLSYQHALVRRPSPKYGAFYAPKGISVFDALAKQQHDAYITALDRAGVEVNVLPAHPEHHDCVFIEDTAVVWRGNALITRMNNIRQGEQRDVEPWLADHFQISHVPPGARLEGGDVLHLDDVTLVGRSERTNDGGIETLRKFMEPLGHKVIAVPVTRCLHLKSAITYLGQRTLLVSPELIDLEMPDYSVIETASKEPHAANALRVNDSLLMAANFPRTNELLNTFCEQHGVEAIELDISEFQKGDGALTCQSILW